MQPPYQLPKMVKKVENLFEMQSLIHSSYMQVKQYRTEFDTAKLQRDSNAAKIEQIFSEHRNIYDSIGQKADKSHTHAKDGSVDCGLFGLGCAFDDLTSKVGTYALIAGAGIIGFLILRSKI